MDVMDTSKAIMSGIISIPHDAYMGLERTLQDLQLSGGRGYYQRRNLAEDAHFSRGVIKIIRNRHNINEMARMILNNAFNKLPDSAISKIYAGVLKKQTEMESRWVLQTGIVTYLAQQLCDGIMMSAFARLLFKIGLTTAAGALLTQGILANAAKASRELALTNPNLYQKLFINDYDMLYFLFETPMKKLNKLIKLKG